VRLWCAIRGPKGGKGGCLSSWHRDVEITFEGEGRWQGGVTIVKCSHEEDDVAT